MSRTVQQAEFAIELRDKTYLRKEINIFTVRFLIAVKKAVRKSDLIIAEALILIGYQEGKRDVQLKKKINIINKIFSELKRERAMATIPTIVKDEIKEQAKTYMSGIKGDKLTNEDVMIAENLIIFGYLLAKDEAVIELNYPGTIKNENNTEKNAKAIISAEWN